MQSKIERELIFKFLIFVFLNTMDFISTIPVKDFELNPIGRLLLNFPLPIVGGVKLILFPSICVLLFTIMLVKGHYRALRICLNVLIVFYLFIVSWNCLQLLFVVTLGIL